MRTAIADLKAIVLDDGTIRLYSFGAWYIDSEPMRKTWALYNFNIVTLGDDFILRTTNIIDAIQKAKELK